MMRTLPLVAALALFACGKKPEDGGAAKAGADKAKAAAGKAKAAAKKAADAVKGTAAGPALKAPATVIMYGGTGGLTATLKTAHTLASKVAPLPPADQLAAQATQVLAGDMRLKNGDALDMTKPIRFAVLDPKKHSEPLLLVGIKSTEALVASLPDTEKKAGDQGNAHSYVKYKGSKRPIFVNFVDGFAVFSRDAGAFPSHKAFIEALAKATMPDLGAVYVELDHVVAIFGAELDQGLAQAKSTMDMIGSQGAPGVNAEQMKSLGKMIEWLGKAAREVDYLRITVKADPDGARADFRVAAKKGSNLASALGAFKSAGPHTLLAKLPADAPFFVSMSADPSGMLKFMDAITDTFVIGPMFGGDTATAKPYIAAMKSYAQALDGQMAVAAHGKDGLELSALFGVKDGKSARAAQTKLAGMHKEPTAQAYYKQMNLSVEYTENAYKVGDTPVAIAKTTMTNVPAAAAPMMALMNDFMTQHIAIGDTLAAMGYGAAGKATVEMLLGGKSGGLDKQPGVQRAIKNAANDPTMLMYLSPIEVAQRIKLGGMNTFAQQLAGIPGGLGLAVSTGRVGEEFQLVIDVPLDLVKSGMGAFDKVKGGL